MSNPSVIKTIDLMAFDGYDYEFTSINAQKVNIIGGLVVNDARNNVKIGTEAGLFLTTGYNNILLGNQAGKYLTIGYDNFLMGTQAGFKINTSYENCVIGKQAAYNLTSGTRNCVYGYQCGYSMDVCQYNVLIGNSCGHSITGAASEKNAMIGYNTGQYATTVVDSVYIGQNCAQYTNGMSNVMIGLCAGGGNNVGPCYVSRTVFVGYYAGANLTSPTETATATGGAIDSVTLSVGASAVMGYYTNWSIKLTGGSGSGQIRTIASYDGDTKMAVVNSNWKVQPDATSVYALYNGSVDVVCIGTQSGESIANAKSITYVGSACGRNATGDRNVYVGTSCGESSGTSTNNVAIGYKSSNSGKFSTTVMIGSQCGELVTTGATDVVCIGTQSGQTLGDASRTVFAGARCGQSLTGVTVDSVMVGCDCGMSATDVDSSVYIGDSCGKWTNGDSNVMIGVQAGGGENATPYKASRTIYIGYLAGSKIADATTDVVCIGTECGKSIASAINVTYVGSMCGTNATGDNNVYIGTSCGESSGASAGTVAIGYKSGNSGTFLTAVMVGAQCGETVTTSAVDVVCVGTKSGQALGDVSRTVLVGTRCGQSLTGVSADSVMVGCDCGISATDVDSSVYIGDSCGKWTNGDSNVMIGAQAGGGETGSLYTATRGVYIGYRAGGDFTDGATDVVCIGTECGRQMGGGTKDTYLGSYCGQQAVGKGNVYVGTECGMQWNESDQNVGVGYGTMYKGGGDGYNVAAGSYCLSELTTGKHNVALGHQAANGVTSGEKNVILGYQSGMYATTGSNNCLIGWLAGGSMDTGRDNTAVGKSSGGTVSTGDYNTFLGSNSQSVATTTQYGLGLGYNTQTASYGIAIGANAIASANSIVLGTADTTEGKIYARMGINQATFPPSADYGCEITGWTRVKNDGLSSTMVELYNSNTGLDWAITNDGTTLTMASQVGTSLTFYANGYTNINLRLGILTTPAYPFDVLGTSQFKGDIIHAGATTGTLTHKVPASITTYSITYPSAQGTGALTNDGSGNLSWTGTAITTHLLLSDLIGGTNGDAGHTSLVPYIAQSVDPLSTDLAYKIGMEWINTTSDEIFFCVDNVTNAIWRHMLCYNDLAASGSTAVNMSKTKTIAASAAMDSSSALIMTPIYSAASAYTVTQHLYSKLMDPSGGANVTITHAAVAYFNADAGTHKALDAGNSNFGTTSGWMKYSINGTLGYVPIYSSATPVTVFPKILAGNGTVTLPSYAFSSEAATGFYWKSSALMGVSCNNSNIFDIASTGIVLKSTKALAIVDGAATNTISVKAPATSTTYDLVLPASAGALGNLLINSTSTVGQLTWSDATLSDNGLLLPSTQSFVVRDSGSKLVFISAPNTITGASYYLRMPTSSGSSGSFLYNGSTAGQLTWSDAIATIVSDGILIAKSKALGIKDGTDTYTISVKAPATGVSANYDLVLPTVVGSKGNVLINGTTTAGQLQWSNAAFSSAGTLTLASAQSLVLVNTGSVSVKAATASATYNYILPVGAGTTGSILYNGATPGQLTWSDAIATIVSDGILIAKSKALGIKDGTDTYTISVKAPATGVSANYDLVLPTVVGNKGSVLINGTTTAGQLQWSNAAFSSAGTLTLASAQSLVLVNTGSVSVKAATASATYNYILPVGAGTTGSILYNGATPGQLTWSDAIATIVSDGILIAKSKALGIKDGTDTYTISVKAPATGVSANYDLVLPTVVGSKGNVLINGTTTAGQLEWSNAAFSSGGTLTLASTQSLVLVNSGSVSVKAATSSATYSYILPASAGTTGSILYNGSTPGQLVWSDNIASIATGGITLAKTNSLIMYNTGGTYKVTLNASLTTTADYTLILPTTVGAVGNVLINGTSTAGQLQWSNAAFSAAGTLTLASAQSLVLVNTGSVSVKAATASATYNYILPASAGTTGSILYNGSTPGQLTWSDAIATIVSDGILIAKSKALGIKDGTDTYTISVKAPATGVSANYDLVLPTVVGSKGNVLINGTSTAGQLEWSNAAFSSGGTLTLASAQSLVLVNTGSVSVKAATASATYNYILPAGAGTTGSILYNGSTPGQLVWSDNIASIATGGITLAKTNSLIMNNTAGTYKVTLNASLTTTADYTLILPTTVGAVGNVLINGTSTAGRLQWSNAAFSSGGTLTLASAQSLVLVNTGSVSVKAATASATYNYILPAGAGTTGSILYNGSTPGQLVWSDSIASIATGGITLAKTNSLIMYNTGGTYKVTLNASLTTTADYILILPTTVGAVGNVLINGTSTAGQLQWSNAAFSAAGTLTLASAQSLVLVNTGSVSVKAATASATYNYILPASAGTTGSILYNGSTPGQLVWSDSIASIATGGITLAKTNSLIMYNTGGTYKVTLNASLTTTADYSLILPTTVGAVGNVLINGTSTAGQLQWSNAAFSAAGTLTLASAQSLVLVNTGSVSVKAATASATYNYILPTGAGTTGSILYNGSTPGQLVWSDSIASIATGGITLASGKSLILTNNAKTVSLQASAAASATYDMVLPANAGAVNQVLTNDSVTPGKLVWSTLANNIYVKKSTIASGGGTINVLSITPQADGDVIMIVINGISTDSGYTTVEMFQSTRVIKRVSSTVVTEDSGYVDIVRATSWGTASGSGVYYLSLAQGAGIKYYGITVQYYFAVGTTAPVFA